MPKTAINQKMAKKIQVATEKVEVHHARKAATLAHAFDRITRVANLLAVLHADADKTLQGEIELLRMICRRFITKVKSQQRDRTGILKKALHEVEVLEQELADVAGPRGYQLKKLAEAHRRDTRATTMLKGNLQVRAREAAFVLAELEQAVNPVSGLKLVSATQRAKNDKRRKETIAKFQNAGDTAPETPAVAQSPVEQTS